MKDYNKKTWYSVGIKGNYEAVSRRKLVKWKEPGARGQETHVLISGLPLGISSRSPSPVKWKGLRRALILLVPLFGACTHWKSRDGSGGYRKQILGHDRISATRMSLLS